MDKNIDRHKSLILIQSKTMKRVGYLIILLGIFIFSNLALNIKFANYEIEAIEVIVFVILIVLFLILPLIVITTKKKLVIENDTLSVKSNRKRSSINANFRNIISWRKIRSGYGGHLDFGEKIRIEFDSHTITLSSLEYKDFFRLHDYLAVNYHETKVNN